MRDVAWIQTSMCVCGGGCMHVCVWYMSEIVKNIVQYHCNISTIYKVFSTVEITFYCPMSTEKSYHVLVMTETKR